MEENLLRSLNELKAAIDGDFRVLAMLEAEKEMYQDETIVPLVQRKNAAEEDYELAIKIHGENSLEAKEKEKALYLAKKELDEHPSVKKYNDAFIVVRDIYMEIDDVIFSPFRKKTLGDVC
ncbi:MAG: YlbF family regulator [Bacilli bacterium]|nr:YlbF family regulator [Bacilli bacterium]